MSAVAPLLGDKQTLGGPLNRRDRPKADIVKLGRECVQSVTGTGDDQLFVFRSISTADLADLGACQLLRRDTGWIAGFAEKTIQTRRSHDP
jgi:hypothetical protein